MSTHLPVREPVPVPEPAGPAPAPPRPRRDTRWLPGLLLIALGVVLLIANLGWVRLGGATLFLGLSAAFLLARFLSGSYGFAVPAGILAGFGSYVALEEAGALPGDHGGWFFILLGLGFVAVYVIGLRPAAIWPFFPAAALIGFGVLLEGLVAAWPLAALAWVASYWPVVLVAAGLWLLVRDRLPAVVRQPLAVIGAVALIVYGIIAVVSTIAAQAGPYAGPLPRPQLGLPGFGGAALTETATLTAPIAAGETLRINNPNGRTVVRAGDGAEVRVVATKHYASGPPPEVRLSPGPGGLVLEWSTPGPVTFGRTRVDYVVEAPAATPVTIESASGDVEVAGLTGAVQVATASGDVALASLSGPVTVRTISGDQRLTDVTGELRISTTSGGVQGAGLVHLREATSISGDLRLSGVFTDTATIKTTSGDVMVRFAPASAARIEVTTVSGDIRASGLALTDQRQTSRSLSGMLGTGGGLLRIETVSGGVSLAAA
jgi:hypothetical protein